MIIILWLYLLFNCSQLFTTHKRTFKIVFVSSLEEGGGTALGPSLIVAIKIASKHPGSKIIVCTDGMANVGLGRLDEFKSDQEQDAQESFYETVANLAVGKG